MTLRDRLRYSMILSIVLTLAVSAMLIDSVLGYDDASRTQTQAFTNDADRPALGAQAEMDRMRTRSVAAALFLAVWFAGQFAMLAFYARGMSARINALTLTVEKITHGDLDASQTIVSGTDEIGRLGAAFRQRTESLIQANRVLLQRENRLNSLLAAIPDLIFIMDTAGNYLDVFTASPELLAIPREALIGKNVAEVFPPEISEPMKDILRLALASGEMQEHEYSIATLNGVGTFQARTIVFDDDGGATRLLWLAHDVTAAKHTEQDSRRRIEELEALNQISAILVANQEVRTLMDQVGEQIRAIFKVPIAYIAVLDPQTNQFHYSYFENNVIEVPPVPFGRGISTVVVRSQKPILINSDWERLAIEYDVVNPEQTPVKSWLGVPMIVGGRPIGLAAVIDTESENAFDDNDVRLLTTLASNVAVALENARLFSLLHEELFERKRIESELRRRMQEIEAINNVSQTLITASDLASVLDAVGGQIKNLFDVPVAYIAIYNQSAGVIDFPYYYYDHEPVATESLPFGRGITSHVINTRQPLLINSNWDAESAKYDVVRNSARMIKSSLHVPMIVGDHVLGVISLQDPFKENAFTEDDLNLLMTIASNLGVAVENSQLFAVVQQELQERKKIEAALRASEEMFRNAIAAAGAVPYTIDYTSNSYVFLGDDIEKITGYPRAMLTPQKFESITQESYMRGELAEYSTAQALRLLRKGKLRPKIWQSDFRILTNKGETRWLSDASIQIADEDGKITGATGILQNITERKANEERIQIINEELEERVQQRTTQFQDAIRELERFSYTVSHDLRAPLRAVHGYSRIIVEDYGKRLPKTAIRHLEKIQQSAHTMGKLVDDLLGFIRLGQQPIRKQLIDLTAIFRNTYASLGAITEKRAIHFVLHDLPPCYADPEFMKMVIVNLLSNAIKFTAHQPNAEIEVGAQKHPFYITYYVKDNGVGFDMQYAHKLFGVFQRLHAVDEFEGTGAGLAMVQRIIQKHGGAVRAEGSLGKGAIFFFTLPVVESGS
jgi:PAS domain S-box-containing protein